MSLQKYAISNLFYKTILIPSKPKKTSIKVHRIIALKDIPSIGVKAGDIGGYVESHHNLSDYDDCWIHDNACVIGHGSLSQSAQIRGSSIVVDGQVSGFADISGNVLITGNDTHVHGSAKISGNVIVNSGCEINDFTSISGNVSLGQNSVIACNAVINSNAGKIVISDNCYIGHYTKILGSMDTDDTITIPQPEPTTVASDKTKITRQSVPNNINSINLVEMNEDISIRHHHIKVHGSIHANDIDMFTDEGRGIIKDMFYGYDTANPLKFM